MVLDAMTKATEVDVTTSDTTAVVEVAKLTTEVVDSKIVACTGSLVGEELGGVLTG